MPEISAFRFYPAIDLKNGECVRLSKGDMDSAKVYNRAPLAQAEAFRAAGARYLHVVDLDGACSGRDENGKIIALLSERSGLNVQTGGGIRTAEDAEKRLNQGAERVIFGTSAIKAPNEVLKAAERFPGRILIGVDARGGLAASEGWREPSALTPADLIARFKDAPLAGAVFTVIERDGMLEGPDMEATLRLAETAPFPVILSGGVTRKEDVLSAARLHAKGIGGLISGRALYEGTLTTEDALAAVALAAQEDASAGAQRRA